MSILPRDILQRKADEDRYQYTWRIGKYMESQSDWRDCTPFINKELGVNYDESAHRKMYQLSKRVYNSVFNELQNSDEYVNEIRSLEWELDRAKQKYRDERNEFNKMNRKLARHEATVEMVESAIKGTSPSEYNISVHPVKTTDSTSLIIVLSDFHIGEFFDNCFGEYSLSIAQLRLKQYADRIQELQHIYHAGKAYVVMCGDLISGNIHHTISITNRENIIQQVISCSELIAQFLARISPFFDDVYCNDVPGNHSRITQNKDECLPGEKLDILIPVMAQGFLSRRYNTINNIHFEGEAVRKYGDTISAISVSGIKYLVVHGDYDNVQSPTALANLENMAGFKPYGVICGHKHHFLSSYSSPMRVYQGGCLGGSGNDYTETKRLTGKPSQLILACNAGGVTGIHPVELS